jgi:preprotein translocase subunit SecG
MLHTLLIIVHFFCAVGIISLVLLQRGKGADAGAGFGAGASGTVFGARGATTALSRATAVLAGIFMVTSLLLTYVGTHKSEPVNQLEQFSLPAPRTAPKSLTLAPAAPSTPAGPQAPSGAPAPTGPASSTGTSSPK